MIRKPVVLFPLAERDVRDTLDHYLREGGSQLAASWVDEVEAALRHIGFSPKTGSARYATALQLGGLRFWPVKRFPYLVFYVEREAQVDVWRLLHGQREVPEWLQPP